MIKLGDKVRDMITGFTGIAVGRTDWLYGCARIGVEPTELRDGKTVETHWFDEQRVELIEAKPIPVSTHSNARVGGPQSDPAPRHIPNR